jgi:hypothetical protein
LLSQIDRVRLAAHGDPGRDEPEEGNEVSFSKARRERAISPITKLRARLE